jgi:hypothetical protein
MPCERMNHLNKRGGATTKPNDREHSDWNGTNLARKT